MGRYRPYCGCAARKLQPSSACSCHRRSNRQVGSSGARGRLCVPCLPFNPTLHSPSCLAPLLEKDCAVCKDQFSLQTDDPDEQLVVTLPCKHPFHSPCITPWLKQNGTCPTCRYQLVPQPGSTQNPNNHSGTVPGPSTSTTNPPRPTSSAIPEPTGRNDGAEGGFLSSLGNMLHSWAGGHPTTGPVPSSSDSGPDFLPGRWETHPSSGLEPRHPPATSYEDQRGSPNSPSYTNPDRRDRRGGSIGERIPHHSGSHRRDSNGERGRRDRAGQRGYPWDRQTPG